MVVVVWLLTAACPSVSPGIADIICHQYVNRLNVAARITVSNSSQVRLLMVRHTEV